MFKILLAALFSVAAFTQQGFAQSVLSPDDADQVVFTDDDELTPEQIAEDMGLAPEQPGEYDLSQQEFWGKITQRASGSWVKINVSLSKQQMHLVTSSGQKLETIVSTGRPGLETPKGCWHVNSMETMHYSKKYNNAPMPYTIFFYRGYAIHGSDGKFDGKPHSHGCVRLPRGTDKKVFNIVKQYKYSSVDICVGS